MTDNKKKILIVEDTPEISKVATFALEEAGYEVEVAENGIDGLNRIKEGDHDLIILDLVMPGKTGFQVLNELKLLAISKPVIVYSNLPGDFTREEAIRLGAVAYYEKSQISLDTLVKSTERFLSRKNTTEKTTE